MVLSPPEYMGLGNKEWNWKWLAELFLTVLENLGFLNLKIFVPRENASTRGTTMEPLIWKIRLSPAHFRLLVSPN